MLKHLPTMQETLRFNPWVLEDPLEKGMAIATVIPGESHGHRLQFIRVPEKTVFTHPTYTKLYSSQ